MRELRCLFALAMILSFVGCSANQDGSDTGLPSGTGDDSGDNGGGGSAVIVGGNPIPFDSLTGGVESESLTIPAAWTRAARPVEPAPTPTGGNSALLNEVLYMPATGESQFVEILAAVGGTLSAGLLLTTETGDTYRVPDGAPVLAGGGILLVVFDGQGTISGNTIHADRNTFLSSPSGTLHLLDAVGAELDQVNWGTTSSDAVSYGLGGDPIDFEEGMTLGRLPHSLNVSRLSWNVYAAVQATPGAPNLNLGTIALCPLNGEVINSGDITLSWFPSPDATSYEVQLAGTPTLDSLVLDRTVAEPLTTITLGEGTYYWRIQAVFADGSKADWSPIVTFTLDDGIDLSDDAATARSLRTKRGIVPTRMLRVPKISQHKDTNMLLLESLRTDIGHSWDQAHSVLDVNDKADNMNCALASSEMINHYFQGTITQDRLGYELHKNDHEGPERDLNYATGNLAGNILPWALGRAGVVARKKPGSNAEYWADITSEIDNGRPLVMSETINGGGHATVVIGYHIQPGKTPRDEKRYLVVNNPWNPNSDVAVRGLRQYDLVALRGYVMLGPGPLNGRAEDPRILGDPAGSNDADKDQINDFDEEVRFGTDKNSNDTDSDCISDKDEIKNSLSDMSHGWAIRVNGWGGDGKARMGPLVLDGTVPVSGRPELDQDSDGGGIPDFVENLNPDEITDPTIGETNPYDPSDDRRHITGTLDTVWHYEHYYSDPNSSNTMEVSDQRYHAEVSLDAEPRTGNLTGTATVRYTNHAYRVYRHPFDCEAGTTSQLNIDHPDREWTATLTGKFYCSTKDGKRVVRISASASPDQSGVADTVTYHDICYSDTQPGHVTGSWIGFGEQLQEDKADGIELRADYDLPTGVDGGEDSYEVHLKFER
jgi:hypothetical protein